MLGIVPVHGVGLIIVVASVQGGHIGPIGAGTTVEKYFAFTKWLQLGVAVLIRPEVVIVIVGGNTVVRNGVVRLGGAPRRKESLGLGFDPHVLALLVQVGQTHPEAVGRGWDIIDDESLHSLIQYFDLETKNIETAVSVLSSFKSCTYEKASLVLAIVVGLLPSVSGAVEVELEAAVGVVVSETVGTAVLSKGCAGQKGQKYEYLHL